MDATREAEGLLEKIIPPPIEDAGLEDCALPPESIKEAFLKAATAVKSRAASIFSDEAPEGDCVTDPWPKAAGESSDKLIGIMPEAGPPGPFAAEKGGGLPEVLGDVVVAGGGDGETSTDEVMGVGVDDVPEEGKACVDGLKGLEIGGNSGQNEGKKLKDDNGNSDDKGEKGDNETPTLVEGCA